MTVIGQRVLLNELLTGQGAPSGDDSGLSFATERFLEGFWDHEAMQMVHRALAGQGPR